MQSLAKCLSIVELVFVILYFKVILLQERVGIFRRQKSFSAHWVSTRVENARQFLATYPERQRFIFHVSRYRIYIWLSIDSREVNRPVTS